MERHVPSTVRYAYLAGAEMMHLPVAAIVSGNASFEQLVAATQPVAWYDFQDTNFNAGTSLQDRSGNSRHLSRTGANNIAVGAAFTSTKTKSANLSVESSTAHYWNDGSDVLGPFIEGQSAVTMTFTFKWDDLSQAFGKILGMRSSNSNNSFAVCSQFPSGTNVFCVFSNAAGTEYERSIGNNDLTPHIYTMRMDGTDIRVYQDGVLASSATMASGTLYASAPNFTIGGSTSGGTTEDFLIDHLHLNNSALDEAVIIAMQNAWIAERL